MSRKGNFFKCHIRFTMLVPLILAQSLLNLSSFCLSRGMFYHVYSDDPGFGGKAEISGVILRHKFTMVNGKGDLSLSYYLILFLKWPCCMAVSWSYLLNKSFYI